MIIKNGNYFVYVAQQIFVMLKRTHKPNVGAGGEERDPTKGTHKNDYIHAGCFQFRLNYNNL